MLNGKQITEFQTCGHITVPGIFDLATVKAALDDVEQWSDEFLQNLTAEQRGWYLESATEHGSQLRKLDEPVFSRPLFRRMASDPGLLPIVERLIGNGVSVFFSQVFCKPPEVGGPKPVHQDNYYFGPDDLDATLTVWIALDDATPENGCLFYADGSHRGPIYPHYAPVDEPFNLQIPSENLADYTMVAAPVAAGGVSFHHGNTWHQSSSNTSSRPRRAVAMHYLRNDASLVQPALEYNADVVVRLS